MGILKITASRAISAEEIKQKLEMENETWVIGRTRFGHATLFTLTTGELVFGVLTTKMLDMWDQELFDECIYDEGSGNGTRRFRIRRTWWKRWALAFLELLMPLPVDRPS